MAGRSRPARAPRFIKRAVSPNGPNSRIDQTRATRVSVTRARAAGLLLAHRRAGEPGPEGLHGAELVAGQIRQVAHVEKA